jgi:hypothetical protein
MATASHHHVVSLWFAQTMAMGDLARDPNAHAQAILAKEDLVKRLDGAKDQPADAVNAWFDDKIATAAIARNTVAYNQAFAARNDLIARLSATAPVTNAVRAPTKPAAAKPPAKSKAASPPPAPPTPESAPETQA